MVETSFTEKELYLLDTALTSFITEKQNKNISDIQLKRYIDIHKKILWLMKTYE